VAGSRIRGHAQGEGGWCRLEGLPGWESFSVVVRAAVVDGHPRVIALRVEPLTDDEPIGLTSAGLKALPLRELAVLALSATNTRHAPELRAAMRKVARRHTMRHDPRAAASVEQVAEVWRLAHEAGQPPRAAVCEQLHLSSRTADRYIARAREAGLITEGKRK